MKRFIEKNVAELVIITVFLLAFSSCASTYCPYKAKQARVSNLCPAYR